jgi:hypothetical protein
VIFLIITAGIVTIGILLTILFFIRTPDKRAISAVAGAVLLLLLAVVLLPLVKDRLTGVREEVIVTADFPIPEKRIQYIRNYVGFPVPVDDVAFILEKKQKDPRGGPTTALRQQVRLQLVIRLNPTLTETWLIHYKGDPIRETFPDLTWGKELIQNHTDWSVPPRLEAYLRSAPREDEELPEGLMLYEISRGGGRSEYFVLFPKTGIILYYLDSENGETG